MSEHIFEFLDTKGNGKGEDNAIVPGDYFFKAKSNKCRINRMLVLMAVSGAPVAETYGNGVHLENGIKLILKSGNKRTVITKKPILVNADWNLYCHDAERLEWSGPKGYIAVRWSFFKSGRALQLEKNDRFIVRLHDDDYSGLLEHYFHIQGYYE